MEATRSTETSVYNKPTQRHFHEDCIRHGLIWFTIFSDSSLFSLVLLNLLDLLPVNLYAFIKNSQAKFRALNPVSWALPPVYLAALGSLWALGFISLNIITLLAGPWSGFV
jgi:hypothetical protein